MRFYAVAELAAAYMETPILAAQDYMLVLSAVRARYTGEPFWGIREKPAFAKIDQRFELSVETQLVDALLKFAKTITTCSPLRPSPFDAVDYQGLKRLAYGVLLDEQSQSKPATFGETLWRLEQNCKEFTAKVLGKLSLIERGETLRSDADSGQGTSHMTGDGSVGLESTEPFDSLFAATQADSAGPEVETSVIQVSPAILKASDLEAKLFMHGRKKSAPKVNAKGSQATKLVSYLASHHRYENSHAENYIPAESATIAAETGIPKTTISDFLKKEFRSSGSPRNGYVQACKNQAKLLHWFMVQFKDSLPERTGDIDTFNEQDIREKF